MFLFALIGARAERVLFAHYTADDGLSSNTVNSVCQDNNGFVWLATLNGVSRFDGVNFKNFNSSTDSVILRNDINRAFLLPNGKPSFSSASAVFFSYDELTGSFVDISSFLPANKYKYAVNGFSALSDSVGLLATACGIYRYSLSSDRFDLVTSNYSNHVLDVCVDKFGRYWIGHFNGLIILDKQGNIMPSGDMKGDIVDKLFKLDDNHILLCSTASSMWLAEIVDEASVPVLNKINAPFNYVTDVVADNDGVLWMGTLGDGLWKCRFDGAGFSFDKVVPLNEPEDALAKISSLFVDNDGNVWVPTQSSGVWRTTSVGDYAYLKSKDIGFPVAIGASFCQLDNGDVMMGTDGNGLFVFDKNLQLKRSVHGLSSNSVLTLAHDGSDVIAGFWGGVSNRYDPKTGSISNVYYNGIDKPRYTTKNITRMDDGSLYVSAAGDGIYRGKNGRWEKLVLLDSAMANYPDIWFEGSCQKPDGSVCLYSSRTIWSNRSGQFKPLLPDADKSLSSNPLHVNHCVANSDNVLFAATNKGLYHFDAADNNLGLVDYVPMGDYASLLVDGDSLLWASGSNGILLINTVDKTCERIMSAGNDFFTGRACLLSDSGNVFFGCKDGFVCVQPGVKANTHVEFLAFAQLTIRGEQIPVGSDLLPLPLKDVEVLNLDYGQTYFSLDFDLVDFSLVNNFVPKYRIPEIDSAWIDLGNKRNIDVNYLPAGNFTVQLAAFSGNSVAKMVSLRIHVSPPWWSSLWFRCLVVILLVTLLYLFYRARINRMLEYRRELQMMVEERTRDLNMANRLLAEQKDAIEASNQSLLDTLKQKDQMVSVVAHDLKNPMFAVVATLKRMITHVYTPAEQQRLLTKLANESEGLQKQMVDMLQWANGEAVLSSCLPAAVDANVLVDESLSLLNGLADEKDIALCQVGTTEFATWADSRMFSTIVRNLVTNAIKFSPKGSKVVVQLLEDEANTILKVVDNGVGMTQDKVNQLLSGQKITSTSGTEQEVGFGFGFKIVLDYLRKNNGSIHIDSIVGQGTAMVVSLPRCADERLISDSVDSLDVELPINKQLLAGKSILVVDDDDLILEHISSLLSPYVEVLQAHDGVQGVDAALSHVPDLIISDVDMPNLNGIEMYEKLMENILTSNIPLLFLSAKTDNSVRLKGLSIGAIDYIAKPFADNELLVKICNFLLWQQKIQLKALTKSYEGNDDVPADSVNPLLEKIISLVKDNYANPLYSLADITQELGMSKATLSRRLKAITDKTPMEILTEYRLNMSRKLLAQGNMSVGEVAYAVGFNDPSYFSRRFKEVFGNTPKSAR